MKFLWMYANHKEKLEKIMSEKCPKCGKEMVNMGRSGAVYLCEPVKRKILHACDNCKVVVTTIEQDEYVPPFGGRNLKEYEFL